MRSQGFTAFRNSKLEDQIINPNPTPRGNAGIPSLISPPITDDEGVQRIIRTIKAF